MQKFVFLLIMILAVTAEVVGDFFFKKWSISDNIELLNFGIIFYFTGALMWALSLKFESLSKAIIVFVLMTLVLGVALGVIVFKEELSLANKFGLVFAVLGLVLIEAF